MISITQNDIGYVFTDQLLDAAGAPADLTEKSVRFVLRAGDTIFADDATVDPPPTSGLVRYAVGATFPTTPGDWLQQWKSVEGETFRLSYANDGYNLVRIIKDLEAPA